MVDDPEQCFHHGACPLPDPSATRRTTPDPDKPNSSRHTSHPTTTCPIWLAETTSARSDFANMLPTIMFEDED